MHQYEFLQSALEEAADHYKLSGIQIKMDGDEPVITGADSVVEARLFGFAIQILSRTRQNLGQAILTALWHVYKNGFVRYMENEFDPSDFPQWARETLDDFEDDKYSINLSWVVARVLQDVHTRQIQGVPYHEETGQEITVSRLLDASGIIKKLISVSGVWETADADQREELLDTVLNAKSHSKVKVKVDQVRDGTESVKIVLPYLIHTGTGGKTTVVFEDLDAAQLELLQGLISGSAEVSYASATNGVLSGNTNGGALLW